MKKSANTFRSQRPNRWLSSATIFAAILSMLLFLAACGTTPDTLTPESESPEPETEQALTPATHGTVPVTVTITRFIEIEDPDPAPLQGDGDYYARVSINGFAAQTSGEVTGEDFEPFWTFTRDVDTNALADDIPVIIEIFDADGIANPDDEIDINPTDGVVALTLLLDTTDGTWSAPGVIPDNQQWSQGDGDTEHSGIFEGGEIGKVFFAISTVSADGDADGDGLLDSWELHGLDANGDGVIDVDLPAFGADPLHKDLFLEFDWVTGQEPSRAEIQAMKAAFENAPIDAGTDASALGGVDAKPNPDGQPGINLWVDTGNLTDGSGNLVGDDLGGGNEVPGPVGCLDSDFYSTKNSNFDQARRLVFRYGISGDPADNDPCGGGRGEIGGNDFVEYNHDGGTIMHELGHNLNLRHGGDENDNCKPNFVSVMNYDNQFGIRQSGGGSIYDFSPPRFAGGRGLAPLPLLDESSLDESFILDATDSTNQFVFVNANGNKVRNQLDQGADWNGDGDTGDSGLSVNIDTNATGGGPSACENGSSSSSLSGHDDWSRIAIQFRQFGDADDAPINPVEEPEITREELEELEEELNTTDLAIDKVDDPDPVAAGDDLTYTLTISNDGPNPASDVEVTDTLPSGVTHVSNDAGCIESPVGTLTCDLGEIPARGSEDIGITVTVDADLVYNNSGPLTITNSAEVVNNAGPDPDTSNNSVMQDTEVIAVADLEIVEFSGPTDTVPVLIGESVDVTLGKVITNNGPSAPMDTELTLEATAPSGVTVTPPSSTLDEDALGLSEQRAVEETITIDCQAPGNHTVAISNSIEPANAEDSDPDPTNNEAEVSFDVECVIPVAINIKPGSNPNSINLRSTVTVAVLTTAAGEYGLPLAFDATSIDPLSVHFGPEAAVWNDAGGGATEEHDMGHIEDAYELDEDSLDGDDDMVLHFLAADTGLESTDVEACAFGNWIASGGGETLKFFGCDAVRVLGR